LRRGFGGIVAPREFDIIASVFQRGLDAVLADRNSQVWRRCTAIDSRRTRLTQHVVIQKQRRADRQPAVVAAGLDEYLREAALAMDTAVRRAVERSPAREAQIGRSPPRSRNHL